METDELFMAWNCARYVGHVAAAGDRIIRCQDRQLCPCGDSRDASRFGATEARLSIGGTRGAGISSSGAIGIHALPPQIRLHKLLPGVAHGLLAGLVEWARRSPRVSASAGRRRSASTPAAARPGALFEHAAHDHKIAASAGDGVERPDPAEHVECFALLASMPEIECGGVEIGKHRGGTRAREA